MSGLRCHRGGLDAGRLCEPRVAVPGPQRQRPADLGARYRGTHRSAPALPRADPARAQGRRLGSIQTWCRRRLRDGSRPSRDHDRDDHSSSRRPHRSRRFRPASSRWCVRPRGTVRLAGDLGLGGQSHARRTGFLQSRCSCRDSPGSRAMARRRGLSRLTPHSVGKADGSAAKRVSASMKSSGIGASKLMSAPVTGCWNTNRIACSSGRPMPNGSGPP